MVNAGTPNNAIKMYAESFGTPIPKIKQAIITKIARINRLSSASDKANYEILDGSLVDVRTSTTHPIVVVYTVVSAMVFAPGSNPDRTFMINFLKGSTGLLLLLSINPAANPTAINMNTAVNNAFCGE